MPVETGGAEQADRAALLRECVFPSGSPHVAIGGLQLIRATVTKESPASELEEQDLSWHIGGFPGETLNNGFTIMGDLLCQTPSGWFAGGTVVARLAFGDDFDLSDLKAQDADDISRIYAGWSVNALYDFVSSIVRSHVAMHAGCDVDLPIVTPLPHFASFAPDEEDEVEANAATSD